MTQISISRKDPSLVGVRENAISLSPTRRALRWTLAIALIASSVAVFCMIAKGKGWKTWFFETFFPGPAMVTRTRPFDGEEGVLINEFIGADVILPRFGSGVNGDTLTQDTVKLYRTSDGKPIEANVNTSGAGDSIVLQPIELLEPGVKYTFEVTAGVQDTKGTKFTPFKMSFTTSAKTKLVSFPASFEKVQLTHEDAVYTCLTVGPDHKLYASTYDGRIMRWKLNEDGTLGDMETIQTVFAGNGGPRTVIGLRFDPASTAEHPILWLTHGQLGLEGVPDWTSKLSRIDGPNLEHYQDFVVGLPRAHKDHLTNQLDFGPDGCIYFCQGSNTGMGAPDKKWAYRYERMMTAAMIRVDPKLISNPPVNVQTEGGGNHYNPLAPGAPVTIYASGIRLGFDTMWHSNGHVYTATNGSAADANTPETTNEDAGNRIDLAEKGAFNPPKMKGLQHVSVRSDFLLNVEKHGYYGHPNPRRSEFILDGGNPTAGPDCAEVPEYPVGTQPDRNWRKPALNLGDNVSPNGMIEYKGGFFAGALDHKILIVRYSGGDDIVALTPDVDGNISDMIVGIDGMRQFLDPLDLCQDPQTGAIYVAEYRGKKLTLLRPRKDAQGNPIPSEKSIIMKIDPALRTPVK